MRLSYKLKNEGYVYFKPPSDSNKHDVGVLKHSMIWNSAIIKWKRTDVPDYKIYFYTRCQGRTQGGWCYPLLELDILQKR